MMSQTVGALALRPTGNAQGGFYFLSLSTGRVLNRLRATALPMPDIVVDQVHRMAWQQRANPGLLFGDRSVGEVNHEDMDESSDHDDDDDYVPEDDDTDDGQDGEDGPADNGLDAGDGSGPHDCNYEDTGSIESEHSEYEDDDVTNMGDVNTNTDTDVNSDQLHGGDEAGTPENLGVPHVGESNDNQVESEGVDEPNIEITQPAADNVEHMEERDDDQSADAQSLGTVETCDEKEDKTGYNLRRHRERSYKHLYDPEVFDVDKGNDGKGGVMLTTTNGGSEETGQMSMKKGLKVFGEPGYATVKKDMQQLHDRKVMQLIRQKDLSPSQKKEALGYLMFLKKKRCGTIKGRGCGNSRPILPRKSQPHPPFPWRPCS